MSQDRKTNTLSNDSGAVLVEFILSFIVVIISVIGVLDIGWYARRASITVDAVRKGARAAATITSSLPTGTPPNFKSQELDCEKVLNPAIFDPLYTDKVEKGAMIETCRYLERESLDLKFWMVQATLIESKFDSPKLNGGVEEIEIKSVKIRLKYSRKDLTLTKILRYASSGINTSASFIYQVVEP